MLLLFILSVPGLGLPHPLPHPSPFSIVLPRFPTLCPTFPLTFPPFPYLPCILYSFLVWDWLTVGYCVVGQNTQGETVRMPQTARPSLPSLPVFTSHRRRRKTQAVCNTPCHLPRRDIWWAFTCHLTTTHHLTFPFFLPACACHLPLPATITLIGGPTPCHCLLYYLTLLPARSPAGGFPLCAFPVEHTFPMPLPCDPVSLPPAHPLPPATAFHHPA